MHFQFSLLPGPAPSSVAPPGPLGRASGWRRAVPRVGSGHPPDGWPCGTAGKGPWLWRVLGPWMGIFLSVFSLPAQTSGTEGIAPTLQMRTLRVSLFVNKPRGSRTVWCEPPWERGPRGEAVAADDRAPRAQLFPRHPQQHCSHSSPSRPFQSPTGFPPFKYKSV